MTTRPRMPRPKSPKPPLQTRSAIERRYYCKWPTSQCFCLRSVAEPGLTCHECQTGHHLLNA